MVAFLLNINDDDRRIVGRDGVGNNSVHLKLPISIVMNVGNIDWPIITSIFLRTCLPRSMFDCHHKEGWSATSDDARR
jgi:hypothetical protein